MPLLLTTEKIYKLQDEAKSRYKPHIYLRNAWEYPSIENQLCASFGCGRKLTLQESLCGSKCQKCQNVDKLDLTKWDSL